MPPLQHQLKFTTSLHADDHDRMNHFKYILYKCDQVFPGRATQHYMTGHQKPFIGYITRAGTTAPVVYFIEQDALLTKVNNLLDLISWTSKEGLSDFRDYIEDWTSSTRQTLQVIS